MAVMTDATIFHILPKCLWHELRGTEEYRGDTLDTEGFIHCSTELQVIPTANRFFVGRDEHVVLRIDPKRVIAPVIYEDTSGGGVEFPHIYGPLNLSAVEGIHELLIGAGGLFERLSEYERID